MPDIIDFTKCTRCGNYRVRAHPYRDVDGLDYAATVETVRDGELDTRWFFFGSLIELEAWVDDTIRTLRKLAA